MMKLLIKLVAAVLAGMIISYATLINSIIEQLIEQEGSKLLLAQVDVEEVEFSIFSGRLTINTFAATNPYKPEANLVTATSITGKIDWQALLSKKIILDDMTITDVRLDQPRNSSGAIPGITPASTTDKNSRNSLPTNTDFQALIDQLSANLQRQLDAYNKQTVDIKSQWQQQSENFIASQKTDEFRSRWNNLQKASPNEKLVEFRRLKKEINAEYSRIEKISSDLAIDISVTREIRQQAIQLIDNATLTEHISDYLPSINQSTGNSIGNVFLGERLKIVIKQLVAAYQHTSPTNTIWPVLIRELRFNGQLDIGATPLTIEGVIIDAGRPASYWQKITLINAGSSPNQTGSFTLSGTIDHRTLPATDRMDLTLTDTPVSAVVLSRNNDAKVVLGQAIVSMDGMLSVRNNQLDLNLNSQFKKTQITVETNLSGSSNGTGSNSGQEMSLAATLADALRGIDRFALEVSAKGMLNNDSFTVEATSSLDTLLENSANQFIKSEQDKLRPQIIAGLQARLENVLIEPDITLGELERFNQALVSYQQSLQALLATF